MKDILINFKYEIDQKVYLEKDKRFYEGRISVRKYVEFKDIVDDDGRKGLRSYNRYSVVIKDKSLDFNEEQFGKDVFLTKEQMIGNRLEIIPLL